MSENDKAAGRMAQESTANQFVPNPARPINCDQVSWLLNAIKRYLPPASAPAVSRAREMQAYALLYEIMEVAHLHFEDDAAQHNGTPPDVKRFRYASKVQDPEIGGLVNKAALSGAASTQDDERVVHYWNFGSSDDIPVASKY